MGAGTIGARTGYSGDSEFKALEHSMLKWALVFLLISIVAGVLGFSGVAAGAAMVAKVLFGVALAIFVIFVILAVVAGEALF